MTDSRINYTVVGGFVLVMLVVLLGILATMVGRTGSTDSYYTTYNSVGGLKFGTQVLYEGYPIGQVEEIIPERNGPNTKFKVVMSVKEGWAIPKNSLARVTASGFLSAMIINITGGDQPEMIPVGGEIPGKAGGNLFSVMSEVAGEVSELTRSGIKPLLDTLNQMAGNANSIAVDDMPAIASNLRQVSEALALRTPEITGNLASMTGKLNTEVLSTKNVESLQRMLSNADQASSQLSQIAGNLGSMSAEVQKLVVQLDEVVTENRGDMRASVKDMRYTLDTLARNIDSITYSMDSTSRNMMEFSRSIRQNPGLLLGGKPQTDEERR